MHCNLKSPNLLLDAGWRVKLTGKCLAGLIPCNRSVAPSVIIITLPYLLTMLLSVPCRLFDAELHASGGPQKRQPTMAGAVASAFSFAYLFSGCPVGLHSARLWSGLRGYATLPIRRAPTNKAETCAGPRAVERREGNLCLRCLLMGEAGCGAAFPGTISMRPAGYL